MWQDARTVLEAMNKAQAMMEDKKEVIQVCIAEHRKDKELLRAL